MVSKERISRPKLCFWVIKPRIIFVRDQFCFGLPSLFLFIFISTRFFLFGFLFNSFFFYIFWVLFPSFSLCFCLLIFLEGVSLTTFGTPFFSYLPSSIRHLIVHSSRGGFSSPLPSNVEGDPWLGYKKEFIRLKKGDYG